MVYRWPEHHTFSLKLPDRVDPLVVSDVLLSEMRKVRPTAIVRFDEDRAADVMTIGVYENGAEIECVKVSFLQYENEPPYPYYGNNRGEGRLTDASRGALETLLEMIGGELTTRGRHGDNPQTKTYEEKENADRELGPFFTAVKELATVTPLCAACEIAKCAEIEDEKAVLLRVLSNFTATT
jgi:hypothetical protein|nr:hypothetical protein [Neorhizobium tomejilense]